MTMPLATAGCGKPDASGVYVAFDGQKVILIQLVQTSDGKLTGRVQETAVTPDGAVKEQSANADGSISGNELLLRPESIWSGGMQASGMVTGSELKLTGENFTLTAERSSLAKYQEAVVRLRSNAAIDRQRIADARAAQAADETRAKGIQDLLKQKAVLIDASNRLGFFATTLKTAIDRSPNFGQQAAANTARVAKMLRTAPTLSLLDRGQLSVAADQIAVNTDQIEVARSQYAFGLNQIVENASTVAAQAQRTCASPLATQLIVECNKARTEIADFKAAIQHGRTIFTPYKNQVKKELWRQALLIQKIDN